MKQELVKTSYRAMQGDMFFKYGPATVSFFVLGSYTLFSLLTKLRQQHMLNEKQLF